MSIITIFLGHYGSGKTELSLQEAFLLAQKGGNTVLVDLDIVNPYFRSGEKRAELEKEGVRVITPNFEGTNVAVPSIPAEINSVFDDENSHVVFDIGGSPSGASALGRYKAMLEKNGYEAVLVVNSNRPFTKTAKEIVAMANEIQDKCRLKITSIINNTNAGPETTAEMLEKSQPIVEQAADMMGIMVKNITSTVSVIDKLSVEFKKKYTGIIKALKIRMRPEWMDS